jgi:integrase
MAEAARLNSLADDIARRREKPRGSIAWVIEQYKKGEDYAELAPGTTKYYKRYLFDIEELGPGRPFAALTRQVIVDFLQTYPARHQKRQCAAVLKNLVAVARYHGLIEIDHTTDLRLKTTAPRDRLWTDDEQARWLAAADQPHMVTAFLLLLYTAQRPSDVLKMTWLHYSAGAIRVRQQKTETVLDVALHPALAAHLDRLVPDRNCLTIVAYHGRPVPYLRFNERFRRIAKCAGIDAQARDLRRTAMVEMAKAGATIPQIASVSGHSIEATQRILETYLPRNRELAAIAITKLAEYQARRKAS